MTPDGWRLVLEGVVAVIAVGGFVLSILGLGYTWWSGRAHVRVSMKEAVLVDYAGVGPTMFVITAFNAGRVPVALTSVGVDVHNKGEKGSTAVFTDRPRFSPPLTFVLEPGRSWSYHADPRQVLDVHRSDAGPVLGPFVNDEGGHHWSSRSKCSWLDARAQQ